MNYIISSKEENLLMKKRNEKNISKFFIYLVYIKYI